VDNNVEVLLSVVLSNVLIGELLGGHFCDLGGILSLDRRQIFY
jgi:hypothetical protein